MFKGQISHFEENASGQCIQPFFITPNSPESVPSIEETFCGQLSYKRFSIEGLIADRIGEDIEDNFKHEVHDILNFKPDFTKEKAIVDNNINLLSTTVEVQNGSEHAQDQQKNSNFEEIKQNFIDQFDNFTVSPTIYVN